MASYEMKWGCRMGYAWRREICFVKGLSCTLHKLDWVGDSYYTWAESEAKIDARSSTASCTTSAPRVALPSKARASASCVT